MNHPSSRSIIVPLEIGVCDPQETTINAAERASRKPMTQ